VKSKWRVGSPYFITDGKIYVAKAFVHGVPKYTVHVPDMRGRTRPAGLVFDSSQDAIAWCEQHIDKPWEEW
jgi:hypothetical protein